jgi:hypothetical protein
MSLDLDENMICLKRYDSGKTEAINGNGNCETCELDE